MVDARGLEVTASDTVVFSLRGSSLLLGYVEKIGKTTIRSRWNSEERETAFITPVDKPGAKPWVGNKKVYKVTHSERLMVVGEGGKLGWPNNGAI